MTEQPICKKCKGTGIIFRRFIPSSTGVDEMRPCPDCIEQPKRFINEKYHHQAHCNAPSHAKPFTKGITCSCRKEPEQPASASPATEDETTPVIEPKTKGKNSEIAGQPLCHQTMTGRECIGCEIDAAGKCPLDTEPEQPNTELLIVKTIQGLMSAASRELTELNKMTSIAKHKVLIDQVLEDITSTENTTLFELQKAFE